jgi:HK97 family phage major capsid protein
MDSIKTLQEKRNALSNTGRAIIDRAVREGRALRASEEVDLEGVQLKIQALSRTLRLSGQFYSDRVDEMNEKSGSLVGCVRALHHGSGRLDLAVANAQLSDPGLARALSAATATAGGFAIPEEFQAEAIEPLRNAVAVRQLGPRVIPSPHGNVVWPRITTPAATTYVASDGAVPVTQPVFAAMLLTAKKQTAMVPVSNTLLRSASPAADFIIRTDLIASAAQLEDSGFLRGNGTADTPLGLRYQVLPANVIASSGTTLAFVDQDLSALWVALTTANVAMKKPGLILSPRTEDFLRSLRGSGGHKAFPEMADGMIKSARFAVTNNVPTNLGSGALSEIYLADFADVVIADYPLAVDASGASSYTDPATGLKVNCFQADQSIIRVIVQSDIAMIHKESIAVLTGVAY